MGKVIKAILIGTVAMFIPMLWPEFVNTNLSDGFVFLLISLISYIIISASEKIDELSRILKGKVKE